MSRHDIVVIGASAGGVGALQELAASLPAGFPAAVLIVLHIGSHRSLLPALLSARGPNPAVHAENGQRLLPGTLYVAPPDHHMLVQDGSIRLTRGAKEHHARPAIDPLFRSAALTYGPRVIGIVLTGRLDDGTAGLQAVEECGGWTMVQDPADAEYPEMPTSALKNVAVDHCVTLASMGATLRRLVDQPVGAGAQPSARLLHEDAVSTGGIEAMENLNAIGQPSHFACPDCDGVLWEIKSSQPLRYRCHTGHAFSLRSLEHTQSAGTEAALWGGLRALQEREVLLRKLASLNRSCGDEREAEANEAKADRMSEQAGELHHMIDAQ